MPKWTDNLGVTIKSLGDGQLANSKGTLYTVPTATTGIVDNIILVNTNTSSETVNLYFKKSGGTSRRLIAKDTSLAASFRLVMTDEITMGAGDIIEGDTTTGSKVDYIINGVEKK